MILITMTVGNGNTLETPQSLAKKATSPAHHVRLLSRHNLVNDTSGLGLAPNYLQANLLILPAKYASDFHDLCLRNPVPCPLLAKTLPGNPHKLVPVTMPALPDGSHKDFDIRTDFPAYRVYRHGRHIDTVRDLRPLWTDEHVGFLIGCSYSFEDALVNAGLPPRHHVTGSKPVAMYRTSIPVLPAGIFTDATFIVSMRPYPSNKVEAVRSITSPYLATHGEPVAWGWDALSKLGIRDIDAPDLGARQEFHDGDVPVFWVFPPRVVFPPPFLLTTRPRLVELPLRLLRSRPVIKSRKDWFSPTSREICL